MAVDVPLVENLLYAEDVLVHTAPSSDAARAYRDVADHLSELRVSRARTQETDQARVARMVDDEARAQRYRYRMLVTTRFDALASARSPAGPDLGELTPRIATMAPFDTSQISTFLDQRLAAAATDAALAARLTSTPALARLASLPMQLRLLADLGSEEDRLDDITSATKLYG